MIFRLKHHNLQYAIIVYVYLQLIILSLLRLFFRMQFTLGHKTILILTITVGYFSRQQKKLLCLTYAKGVVVDAVYSRRVTLA